MEFPRCIQCVDEGRFKLAGDGGSGGVLVPMSDYGNGGAPVHYKAWVCTNPQCGFNLKIRNGEVKRNEPIMDGS